MSLSKDPSTSIVVSACQKIPSVSIIIPTYNEVDVIETVVNGFLSSRYPNLLEVIVVDGQSNDGTKRKLSQLALKYPRVRIIDNPERIQSAALNLGLKTCKGDLVIRADAHCDYAPDYIEQCVSALDKSQALNVGGCQRFVAKHSFQAAVAMAARSLLGNGGAKYRNPNYNGYADTVYLGCFRKEALFKLSSLPSEDVFDPSQVTNEDAELNQRLLDYNSRSIYVSSKIKVWYYPRKSWFALWIQYFKYGRGRYLNSIRHPERSQIRGKLPFLFLSSVLLMLLFDVFISPINFYMKEICFLGVILAFIESLRVNLKYRNRFVSEIWRGSTRKKPSFLNLWFYCGIAILTMPVAHCSGYGFQTIRNRILAVDGW